MDLNLFFEHSGEEQLSYTIAGDEEDFNEHDQFMFKVEINPQTGILTYNPATSTMSTYYSEETQWSFIGVKLKATRFLQSINRDSRI